MNRKINRKVSVDDLDGLRRLLEQTVSSAQSLESGKSLSFKAGLPFEVYVTYDGRIQRIIIETPGGKKAELATRIFELLKEEKKNNRELDNYVLGSKIKVQEFCILIMNGAIVEGVQEDNTSNKICEIDPGSLSYVKFIENYSPELDFRKYACATRKTKNRSIRMKDKLLAMLAKPYSIRKAGVAEKFDIQTTLKHSTVEVEKGACPIQRLCVHPKQVSGEGEIEKTFKTAQELGGSVTIQIEEYLRVEVGRGRVSIIMDQDPSSALSSVERLMGLTVDAIFKQYGKKLSGDMLMQYSLAEKIKTPEPDILRRSRSAISNAFDLADDLFCKALPIVILSVFGYAIYSNYGIGWLLGIIACLVALVSSVPLIEKVFPTIVLWIQKIFGNKYVQWASIILAIIPGIFFSVPMLMIFAITILFSMVGIFWDRKFYRDVERSRKEIELNLIKTYRGKERKVKQLPDSCEVILDEMTCKIFIRSMLRSIKENWTKTFYTRRIGKNVSFSDIKSRIWRLLSGKWVASLWGK